MAGTGRHRVNSTVCHRGQPSRTTTQHTRTFFFLHFSPLNVPAFLCIFLLHFTYSRISAEIGGNRSLALLPPVCMYPNTSTADEWFFTKFRIGKTFTKAETFHAEHVCVFSATCATGFTLNVTTLVGPGIEFRWGETFGPSRPALRPTQPPVQWVSLLSRG